MAWPLSRMTSYSPGALPTIKATDLNAIQDAISSILLGTYSHRALVVDGTGGAPTAPVAGSASISGNLSVGGTARVQATVTGTTAPTTALPSGTMALGGVCGGWAVVHDSGTLLRGYNVRSVARVAGLPTGAYRVTFNATPADPINSAVFATAFGLPQYAANTAYLAESDGGRQAVVVFCTVGGAYVDSPFSVGFFGE